MSSPLAGSIPAAGVANAVVFNLDSPDTTALLEISGAYAGATLVFEAQPKAASKWFSVAGLQQDAQAMALGSPAVPYVISPDGSTLAWKFDATLCQALRVWAFALTTGPIVVNWLAGSFYGSPPGSPGAGGLALQQAILWQLMELTSLVAAGAGLTATSNPVLPGGLPGAIWNRL